MQRLHLRPRLLGVHRVPHAHHELLLRERLHHVIPGAVVEELHQELLVGLGREQEDRRRFELRLPPHRRDHLDAADVRHHDVRHDQRRAKLQGFLEPFAAVERRHHVVLSRQALDDEAVHVGIVFDDEDTRPAACRRVECGGGDAATGRRRGETQLLDDPVQHGRVERAGGRRGARGQPDVRDGDGEAGAAERRFRHRDGALVHLDEFLGDGQSEPGSRHPAVDAAVDLPEPLEDRLPQLRGHTWSRIVDRDRQLIARRLQRAPNPPAIRRELERVPDQVHQHALELVRIDGGDARVPGVDRELDVAVGGKNREVRRQEPHERGDVGVDRLDLQLVGLDPRHVEQIVDVLQQHAGVAGDDFARVPPLRQAHRPGVVDEAPGRPEDERERRPQFVADVGEELGLDLVELADALEEALQLDVLLRELPLLGLLLGDVASLAGEEHDLALIVFHGHDRGVDDDGH